MGMSHSTARWVAPLSFVIDFAAQQYGMLSSPNMKDVHDAHLSFWSPQPYFIAGFFFPQQLFQLAWLYRLYKLDAKKEPREVQQMVDFVPYYAVGNLCIASEYLASSVTTILIPAAWMLFWNSSMLQSANIFVLINSITQLTYVFTKLPPMDTSSTSSVLTHIVSKTFAGIGVLDFLHNGSVAYFDGQGPTTLIKVLTGVGFGGLAMFSDWIFGGCLVYDLIALSVGQRMYTSTSWSNLLGVYAAGTAAIVGIRNYIR